jgi:hypothetical protein
VETTLRPENTLRFQEESMAQEESRKTRRWLLPFTSGVDLPTIASALRLAETGGATLVAVSFIATPGEHGARLELIQQSKDFLEAIRHKALRLSIPIECYEVFTSDVLESIAIQIRDLACDSLVLASRGEKALLLRTQEMQQLVLRPPASLVLLRFDSSAPSGSRSGLRTRLLSWVQQRGKQPEPPPSEPSSLGFVRERTPGERVDMSRKKEA